MHRTSGFTIVELVTAMSIVVILGYAVALLLGQVNTSYARVRTAVDVDDRLRIATSAFTRDLENAYVSPTNSNFNFIGTETQIDFNAFITTANGTEMAELGYRYDASARTLVRREETGKSVPDSNVKSGGTSSIVIDNVEAVSFQYGATAVSGAVVYTPSWDAASLSLPAPPHVVQITLTVRDAKQFAPAKQLVTKVYIENARVQ